MPYANPEDKRRWLKKAIQNGYGKWLYQHRVRVKQDAEKFREALESIENVGDTTSVRIASLALRQSEKRWDSLGPAHANGALEKKKQTEPDSLIDAMAKLGL